VEKPLPDLKLEILPKAQRLLWKELNQLPKSFVLYGGTAVALRLGHRHSVDFDFFSNDHFKPDELLSSLGSLRDARVDQRGDNTLSITVNRSGPVMISFFGDVRMDCVQPPDRVPENELQIASLLDLTATKLKTIQQRAEAKDYLDLAAALQSGIDLPTAVAAASTIYGQRFNALAALKALTYFGDGNLPSLPPATQEFLRRSSEAVDIAALPNIEARPGILRRNSE
jgi:hypothetical protein